MIYMIIFNVILSHSLMTPTCTLFIRTSKILMRLNVLIKVFSLNMFLLALILLETYLPVNDENCFDVNNSL